MKIIMFLWKSSLDNEIVQYTSICLQKMCLNIIHWNPELTDLLACEQNVLRHGKLIHPGRSISTDHQAAQFLPSLWADCHSLVTAGGVRELLNAGAWQRQRWPKPCVPMCRQWPSGAGIARRHKVQHRASHPRESLEIEFVEKTGQTRDLVRQVYWSAYFHACCHSRLFLFPKHPIVCLRQW